MSNFESNYNKDPAKTNLSYIKSAVRIGTCIGVIIATHANLLPVTILSTGFLIAEVIGIIEEWI